MKEELATHPFGGQEHRADIDGLRAVAVLAVVGYHAFPLWLPGGFVGVDVFFVISGFLITGLIIDNLNRGSFSFLEFYARRVKRIFPALLLVLAATHAFGWLVLLADEYQQLGRHVAGGAGFVSNLVLWRESGYFDTASDTKPLLHLWSLGIEEQFYLVWPCLLWWGHHRKWNTSALVLGLMLASFAFNVATVGQDRDLTFYAPHTRFWELFCGALLAWHVRRVRESTARHGGAALGVLLVAAGMFGISDEAAFPGWWAAVPVFGAMLIIEAGPRAWFNRVVLSSRAPVWFGLISYPLYLWHWPLLTFARIVGRQEPTPGLGLGAAGVAVILAWLTYRWVEIPIRFGTRSRRPAAGLAMLMLALGSVGYVTSARDGIPSRRVAQLNQNNGTLLEWNFPRSLDCDRILGASMTFCLGFGDLTQPRIAVLGDSTANALAPGLGSREVRGGGGLINIGSYTCPPIRGLVDHPRWKPGGDCLNGTRRAFELVAATPSIEVVVLGVFARDLKSWGVPDVPRPASSAQRFDVVKRLLDADIRYLTAAGKRVVVAYDMPYARVHARDCLPRQLDAWLLQGRGECSVPEARLLDRQPYLALFDEFFRERDDVCVLRHSDLLLPEGRLRFADETGQLLMRDDHHLSTYGSARMAELFARTCGDNRPSR